jgi:sugar-specific transcriptional regulator TrmB
MDDSSLADLLSQFGLSDKEIDTYLTLLAHGEAKASTVADDAGVSKRYVYSISEKLEERGFVTVEDHVVPTTIRANPPEQVIDTLSRSLDEMEPALADRYTRTAPADARFEVVKSRVTVLKRAEELIAGADEEVTLSIPHDRLPELADELRAALDRGVLVLLVVSGVESGPDLGLEGLASVARAWSQPMPTMLTADRQSGLVAPTEMITRSNAGKEAIAFGQQQLGPILVGSFLGNYWPMAEEVYVAQPTALPATFRDFRHAVLQAELHRRAGTPLRARVRGRLVGSEDDDVEEFVGRVTDVRQGLLAPGNNSFPVENSLDIETDEGVHLAVGGLGAFIEDVEANEVTLELIE